MLNRILIFQEAFFACSLCLFMAIQVLVLVDNESFAVAAFENRVFHFLLEPKGVIFFIASQGQQRLILLFGVIRSFGCSDHWIQLGDHDGKFSDGAKLPPIQLVDEMAESEVVLLFFLEALSGQLEFALDSSHEKIVDDNVAGWIF